MTALDRLRYRLGPESTVPRAFVDLETIRAMLKLQRAVRAYVDSRAGDSERDFDVMHQTLVDLETLP